MDYQLRKAQMGRWQDNSEWDYGYAPPGAPGYKPASIAEPAAVPYQYMEKQSKEYNYNK
jgi:hypothetical protein